MFPESEAEKAAREIALYNDEIERFIELGLSIPDAEKAAQYTVEIQRQVEAKQKEIEDAVYKEPVQVGIETGTKPTGIDGTFIDTFIDIFPDLFPDIPRKDPMVSEEDRKALEEFAKTSSQYIDEARSSFEKVFTVVAEYKQKLLDAGITEEQAAGAASSIEAEILSQINAIRDAALATGDYTAALAAIKALSIDTSSKLGNITDAAKIAGIEMKNLADGTTEVELFDDKGMIEKFNLYGRNAQMARDIISQMTSIADRLQNDIISTGAVDQAQAEKLRTQRIAEYIKLLGQATDGYYTGADGVREYLGQTEALHRIYKEMGYALGTIDTGELWIAQLEDEIEKAKAAAEKIKAAIDPIVEAVIKRIQMSAEDQFSERLKNATTLLEQQRDAEIDAINVRVNGLNQTYGLLDREIKAQEKKNRVLQIEKAILDAKKNVAMAAIGTYGENVDPIEAAQRRREAEIAMTEATKTAEIERSKLAIDGQQTTVEAIQSIFDLRIGIITKAIEEEKMAFQEAIDFLVEKIKNGEIKGTAAVTAIQNAFTQFGIAVPRTVQSIAASGTTPINNIFTQLSRAVDAYYAKIQRIKAIEDTLGSTIDTGMPTQDEIDEQGRVQEQYAQLDRNAIVNQIKTGAYDLFARVSQAANNQIRTGIGTDGKPLSQNTIEARKPLYKEFQKVIASFSGVGGKPSANDLAKITTSFNKFVEYLQRPAVDLYAARTGAIFGGIPPMAKGGSVKKGSTYLTGELGPELITMGANGEVISNFYVKRLTDTFKKFSIGNPAMMPKIAYNMGGGGKAELSVTINNPQVRSDADIDKIVDAVNKSQMRMARRLGYS
jgi:hypothetical protein